MAHNQTAQTLILLGALLGSAVAVLPVAYVARDRIGAASALVALVTCLVSGLLALGLARLCRGPNGVVSQVLLGMLPRMGIPLAVCMMVHLQGGAIANAGFVYYILAFYFVTLVVETVLQVGEAQLRSTEKSTV
ncbi:MAG: hypothetical protein ACYC3X_10650 [Pirellulaceae bacterium]